MKLHQKILAWKLLKWNDQQVASMDSKKYQPCVNNLKFRKTVNKQTTTTNH